MVRCASESRRIPAAASASASGALLTSAQTELRQPLQRLSLIRFRFQRSRSYRRALDKEVLPPLLAHLELELTALRTLAVSETKEGRLLGIVEVEPESGLGNCAGITSQCERKC